MQPSSQQATLRPPGLRRTTLRTVSASRPGGSVSRASSLPTLQASETPSSSRSLVAATAQTLPAGTRITNASVRAALEARLAQTVAQRMADTVARTQTLGADALDLGGMLAGAHPVRWVGCAEDWAALYPELPVTVRAAVRITGTQDLTDPLPEEERA